AAEFCDGVKHVVAGGGGAQGRLNVTGVKDRSKRVEPNAFFDLVENGSSCLGGVGDDHGAGTRKPARGFAEESAGVDVAEAPRFGRVDQDQIEVAREPAVLEPVIEDEDIGVGVILEDLRAACEAV